MPVDFSIKQVPDEVAERLRKRAVRNHRSLQGELRAILETALADSSSLPMARDAAAPYADARGNRESMIAPRSESALMIRADRDGRHLTVDELYNRAKALGHVSAGESIVETIRRMREERDAHLTKVLEKSRKGRKPAK